MKFNFSSVIDIAQGQEDTVISIFLPSFQFKIKTCVPIFHVHAETQVFAIQ